MQTFEAIQQRRSIKHYDTNHVISDEEFNKILTATLLSPTSFNIQNWRFVVVKDKELRTKIREASWNQAQVTEASHLVLVCADLKAAEKNPERYWKDSPKATQDMIVPMILKFYKDNPQLQRDEALRSCGIAAQTLMLAAKDLGYDTCPMVGFDPVKVAEIIKLPQDHLITMMITVGKALKPAWARAGQLDLSEVVFTDTFS